MWVVYSLLVLLGLVLTVLLVPVYARVAYDGTLRVRIWVLGIPVTLLPKPEKPDEPTAKKQRKSTEEPSRWQEIKELLAQDDLEGTLAFLRELAALAGQAAGRLLRAVTVDRLTLLLCVATGDPADTARLYGEVCSVLYPSLSALERVVRIRHRQLRVEPNFLRDQSGARFDVRLHISVIRLAGAALALLVGFLRLKETNSKEVT